MAMSELGAVHLIFSLVSLGSGAWVLLTPKGTRWHRTGGHLYAGGMLGLNVSALFIYRMTGRFGPFHFFALFSLATLGMAMYTVLWRRPRKSWLESHAIWMAWSYVGLTAAAVSETATRIVMPLVESRMSASAMPVFWGTVGLATVAVVFGGSRLIRSRLPGSIASVGDVMRRERTQLSADAVSGQ